MHSLWSAAVYFLIHRCLSDLRKSSQSAAERPNAYSWPARFNAPSLKIWQVIAHRRIFLAARCGFTACQTFGIKLADIDITRYKSNEAFFVIACFRFIARPCALGLKIQANGPQKAQPNAILEKVFTAITKVKTMFHYNTLLSGLLLL